MPNRFEEKLQRLLQGLQSPSLLTQRQIGLEKECLRVSPGGKISQLRHPLVLGSALTHPHITTDYSEALLELITPPQPGIDPALAYLHDLQVFVYRNIGEELLWATSMPCVLAGETSIPIAEYGTSNAGIMKHVYRRGLGYRYGRIMQVIAGVHFNYSLSSEFWQQYMALLGVNRNLQHFVNDQYFCIIRNLLRLGWMVPYLFGVSPAVCKSFFAGNRPQAMEVFNDNTFFEPYATSLRMGDIGYQNKKEVSSGVRICYDDLFDYTECLRKAITTPYPPYADIGVKVGSEYRQLSANVLQIENEYYSSVRPKQITGIMEMPVFALRQRGVRYIELRSLDVNVFDPLGISPSQLYFLEMLMLFCLIYDSPPISNSEREEIDFNQALVAHRGRKPGLMLRRDAGEASLRAWGLEVLDTMQGLAETLDSASHTHVYADTLRAQRAKFEDPAATPSARVLEEMKRQNQGFFDFAMAQAQTHRDLFLRDRLSQDREGYFQGLVAESIENQARMEAEDDIDFDTYLHRYFSALG